MVLETFIEHFDALILFDKISGDLILSNSEFREIFNRDVKDLSDLEDFFINFYKSEQIPIFNTIDIKGNEYLVKRKIIKDYILYHFEGNNYYLNIIETIKKQGSIDELTGAYNKKEFGNIFEKYLSSAKRYEDVTFTVIMFDLDHFKKINDNYGHLAGDYILKMLSSLVISELRDSDIFARVGGEEFMILLPQTKLHGALKAAQKIRQSIQDYNFHFNNTEISVTISLGITSIVKNDTSFSIIDRVDKALYKAKGDGRNRVEYL